MGATWERDGMCELTLIGGVCLFQWSRGQRHRSDSSLTRIADSNPAGGIDVCLLSCRGLCDGPIPRPEESSGCLCLTMCDLETSTVRLPRPERVCCMARKKSVTC
jgi:hypothetical protein